jgi:hypothetical protein
MFPHSLSIAFSTWLGFTWWVTAKVTSHDAVEYEWGLSYPLHVQYQHMSLPSYLDTCGYPPSFCPALATINPSVDFLLTVWGDSLFYAAKSSCLLLFALLRTHLYTSHAFQTTSGQASIDSWSSACFLLEGQMHSLQVPERVLVWSPCLLARWW